MYSNFAPVSRSLLLIQGYAMEMGVRTSSLVEGAAVKGVAEGWAFLLISSLIFALVFPLFTLLPCSSIAMEVPLVGQARNKLERWKFDP